MIELFSYKLTHDTGFAPNPFWGVLSLATCKPQMRLRKKKGQWIAGFTSQGLCGDAVGNERLIYLMEITEEPISIADYYRAYPRKIPSLEAARCIVRAGDNIYRPTRAGDFEQLPNPSHTARNMDHDLSGRYVLLSKNFVYLGRDAAFIPGSCRPRIPKGQSGSGVRTPDPERVKNFIEHVFGEYGHGVKGKPHKWPDADDSWKS